MPGVTNGPKWINKDNHLSDSFSHGMAPQRHHEVKSNSGSQYSNGYNTDPSSDPGENYPTYLLEHLATFSVGSQYGERISTPKDGLRRLLQMEKSSGIWTQKMQMRLEKKWVVIIDNENGDVVERFPMSLISEPTSYTSNDPRELYNNIVVFIVKDDPKNKNQNPPEMHIFQCARVSAQEVVNEMKMFISGKWKPSPKENGRHLPPPPLSPPPEPPVNGVSVREQVNLFNAVAAAAASPPKGDGMIQRVSSSGYSKPENMHSRVDRDNSFGRDSNDETSSTSSEKYERDVAILNHCFDDIERFIARLQHSAAAFKELERRQKSRKNKKKDMGDGMLSIRAKPPSEKEFVDILQKFKLSFNLLAKLKSHIHDPNAPELVHFLFTPLALIVDAAKESNYSTTLASRIVAPLLTRDALELLMNCCTSKESDLWHSLGESWITPREHWEGYEGSYNPVFSDGWAPENPFAEEKVESVASFAHKSKREDGHRSHDEVDMRHQDFRVPSRQDRDSRYGSDYYFNEHRDKERPVSPMISSEVPHSSFENRYYDNTPTELPRRHVFDRNGAATPLSDREMHDMRDRDVRSDFSADSIDHAVASDPQIQFERHQKQFLEDLVAKGAHVVQVMYPRTANNDKELTVIRGEFLEVLDDSRKWWKAKNSRGQVAHVPHTIVGRVNEEEAFHNPTYAARSVGSKDTFYSPSESSVPKPASENGHKESSPPHRPIPIQPAPADWVRRERQGKKDSTTSLSDSSSIDIPSLRKNEVDTSTKEKDILANLQDRLHEELKRRVSLTLAKKVLAVAYITPDSSAEEVQFWLTSKGFASRTQQKFQNVRGDEIFSLEKKEMEKELGNEEGLRLFNQIIIQKNICGFKTLRSKELSSVLEARRKKIDPDDDMSDRRDSSDSVATISDPSNWF
ncbi:epidermal growth factor receptor kinase substrate 8 isoform X4 [Parasteatoda tepidariorum]|uniref:epidermal growth factor receptor kinase substrate 8 isoform X4 n=1 Tax=Parasteatoda tepidariorum TaxID=114398 RepID=UPI0039BD2BA8